MTSELLVKACTLIVQELIQTLNKAEPVNLNALKARISSSLKLSSQPKLVDIIAAIPEKYRPQLLPLLKAKPVRTASGVAAILPLSMSKCLH